MINRMIKVNAPLKLLSLFAIGIALISTIHCGVKGRPQVPEHPPFIGGGLLQSQRPATAPASTPLLKPTPQSGKTN